MKRYCLFPTLTAVLLLLTLPATAGAQDLLSGQLDLEVRGFPRSALFEDQHEHTLSLAIEPTLYRDWARGDQSFTFTPFLRVDFGDAARTHVDARELYWQYVASTWEMKIGLARVFWGVTESQHLVDVINQTDLIESPDGEDKLGQPMVNVTWIRDWGLLDVYVLPWFRERTFPGRDGRLRFPFVVDTDNVRLDRRVDVAVRYFHTIGRFDVGLAHFWGTGREPRFLLHTAEDETPHLIPVYETTHQTSLDVQMTQGSWLWKLEAITRSGQGNRFYAAVGGFEYTFSNLRNTGLDLGLLAEYHYDSRDDLFAQGLGTTLPEDLLTTTPFDDDLFLGTRLALNDVQSTDFLGGVIIDRDTRSTALFIEVGRRLSNRLTMGLEVRSFLNTSAVDPLHSFRRDSYGQLQLSYHF